jgi:hypothetical protein
MRAVDPAINGAILDLRAKMFPGYADFLQSFGEQLAAVDRLTSGAAGAEIKPKIAPPEIRAPLKVESLTETSEFKIKAVQAIFAGMRRWMQRLQKESVAVLKPHLQAIVSQIEEDNWQNFEKNFSKKNEELRKRNSKVRGDKWVDRIEDWTGDLSRDQQKKVVAWAEATPWPVELQIKNRDQLLAEFKKRLFKDGKFSTEVRTVIVDDWIENYEAWAHPEYRPTSNAYYEKMNQMFAELFVSLSVEQKASLQKTITKHATELRSLVQVK